MVVGVRRGCGLRPEMLGLLREVTRLGPPWMDRVRVGFEPLVDRASAFLEAGMESGAFCRCGGGAYFPRRGVTCSPRGPCLLRIG